MAIWLKLVGATDAPMPDRWLDGRTDLNDEVGFNTRASVGIGEDLVLYAIPQRKIIGIAEVRSHPIKGAKDGEERFRRSSPPGQLLRRGERRALWLRDAETPADHGRSR